MESLRQLYKIGHGPSGSHTMGPEKACRYILDNYNNVKKIIVTLYGSLALTGKGHLTDYIILNTRKAIIALESDIEVAVYEFACERIGGLYYYYVDANTGDLVQILKVVDSNGTPLLV